MLVPVWQRPMHAVLQFFVLQGKYRLMLLVKELECCISVGYWADDTAGNAAETAGWVNERGFQSIRLVTASYHMPRSLIEFRHAMPAIRIIPHPVYPPRFKRSRWWLWPGTAALLASEFNKYMIATAGRRGRAAIKRDRVP